MKTTMGTIPAGIVNFLTLRNRPDFGTRTVGRAFSAVPDSNEAPVYTSGASSTSTSAGVSSCTLRNERYFGSAPSANLARKSGISAAATRVLPPGAFRSRNFLSRGNRAIVVAENNPETHHRNQRMIGDGEVPRRE